MQDFVVEKLKELEKTSKEFWNIPPETGNLLNMFIKMAGYKTVLEVGTSNGYSAIWQADALKETGGHMVSIEFYEKRIIPAMENLKYCKLDEYVTIKQGSAKEVISKLCAEDFKTEKKEQYLDMAFIDACKGEYIDYFNLIHPILRKGGLLVADNVISHKKSLSDFLELIHNHEDYQHSYIEYGGGALIALKIR